VIWPTDRGAKNVAMSVVKGRMVGGQPKFSVG